jgi:hypothetical protein
VTLKYNRKGFRVGIPARDLSDAEVEQFGGVEFLIGTGLYMKDAGFTLYGRPVYETSLGIDVPETLTFEELNDAEQQAPAAKPKRKTRKGKNEDTLTRGSG